MKSASSVNCAPAAQPSAWQPNQASDNEVNSEGDQRARHERVAAALRRLAAVASGTPAFRPGRNNGKTDDDTPEALRGAGNTPTPRTRGRGIFFTTSMRPRLVKRTYLSDRSVHARSSPAFTVPPSRAFHAPRLARSAIAGLAAAPSFPERSCWQLANAHGVVVQGDFRRTGSADPE